jgi:putative nucleotidyltransferase with HDIG domain
MVSFPLLPANGRVYISTVILAGTLVVGNSVYQLIEHPIGFRWFLLAALTLISGSATVKLPSVPASISISETFVFAAVLLYGPPAGALVVALDGLVISFWISRRRQEPYRALFNMSAPSVSAWAAAELFFWLSGIKPLATEAAPIDRILPSLITCAVTYFSLNSWLIAFAIAVERRLSPVRVWREHFVWLSLNYFCGASVAVLLVLGSRNVDLQFIGVIIPLLLVLYFTFKTSMDRVEDANRHVAKVNSLYLSTIETLALAVDAKDQVTSGHIRRVQRYTVGLARALGVSDESLLKAIEAAALLHDMGKLAIPERILNKPGKLTEAEFEKMKAHASVGAEMLSAIEFPYPVVPIVRHHHESWDGSGYPDGLRGTDIPIGARILSVVDCFDALTSDRPYRKRLSNEEALSILNERKGTMYDPWIVQTFERVHMSLEPEKSSVAKDPSVTTALPAPTALARASHPQVEQQQLRRSEQEAVALECEALLVRLRHRIQADAILFYRYDTSNDDLVARYADTLGQQQLLGLRIGLGDSLSGWVAANRAPIMNTDAALDLGELVERFRPRLRHALGLPVIAKNRLIGVLTMYSSREFTLNDQHVLGSMVDEVIRYGTEEQGAPAAILALRPAG